MWRNRNVWIVLAGEFIAGLGMWTSIIANLEFMQQHVPSDFMKSLILFTGLLAGIIVGPLAGRVVDSNRKKKVLIIAGIGRLISVCFMFLALAFDSVAWMVVFGIALQLSMAFMFPALQALIPQIVSEKDLMTLNGVFMNASTIARILGTALAGALLLVMSLYTLYLCSFIAYALLLLSTCFLKVDEEISTDKSSKNNSKGAFKEMIPVLKTMPVAMMMLGISLLPILFLGSFNLMVINISELQNSVQIKGLLYAAEGICFFIAALFVKRIMGKGSTLKKLFGLSVVIAISQFLLFFADIPVISIVSFGLLGFALGCFFPLVATYFQTGIPKEYHGRFFSLRGMLERLLFQVVLLSSGFFLDTIGLKYMVLIFGAVSIAIVLYSIFQANRLSAYKLEAASSAS
ncbi:MFS transporter [Paenibacillus taiwanensis]|uniref:MFS transporter n=1 Tax=Paenibacillus taiwanensis TaxID=401638 RepID=UPI000428F18C|nr:MFS transporter [Paenibacillus taiwanensis]